MFDSVIRVQHISSYDDQRFLHYLGYASDDVMDEVSEYLIKHFQLKNA